MRHFADEYHVSFIGAPIRPGKGKLHYWDSVSEVRVGDLILSFVRQEIVEIGRATSGPGQSPRAFGNILGGSSMLLGRRVKEEYTLMKPTLKLSNVPHDILINLAIRNGSLNRKLTGNQGEVVPAFRTRC